MTVDHLAPDAPSPEEVAKVRALAHPFSSSGEWSNAHALLERTLALMESASPPTSEIQFIEVKVHIVVLLLYGGKYDEATKGLQELKITISDMPLSSYDLEAAKGEIKRWDAMSKLFQGYYQEAVDDFEKLPDAESTYSKIRILRD
jgi:hypothetical protein